MSQQQLPERARLHGDLYAGTGPVPERVRASWQRSEEYGVPLESVQPVFSGSFDGESLFYECGSEVLSALQVTLADEPISLMLTDADGLVLNRLSGDRSLLRALDAVHLAPGFAYSERAAGTNGLGLALADRVPTVVRAEEHYSLSLSTYTCAAVPVLDPVTGRLEGCVNLTTWSRSSSDLLLALAQAAAGNTAALMLGRSRGQVPARQPRGEVFRVEAPRLEPGAGTLHELGAAWNAAGAQVDAALAAGRVAVAVGEPGSGRSTLLAQAVRHQYPRERILSASAPAPQDVAAWLDLWTPELRKPQTGVVVRDVERLPAWGAERLRDLVLDARQASHPTAGAGRETVPFAMTASAYDAVPDSLAGLVDTVVAVPALRDRPDDVLPLARHAALRLRGRDVAMSPGAVQALRGHAWPGNVAELVDVVRSAATRTDLIDVGHLPPEVLTGSGRRRLTRIEAFERDEILRVLTRPGTTMREAAAELGMSRATVYRKVAQYDLHVPRA